MTAQGTADYEDLLFAVQGRPAGPQARWLLPSDEPVVVVDRVRGYGVMAFATDLVSSELLAYTVRHTSGFVQVVLPASTCDRLDLRPLSTGERYRHTVTVDAAHGITTGISARDRSHTLRLLADPQSSADDFTRPGHMVPIRANAVADGAGAQVATMMTRAGLAGAVFAEVVSTESPSELAGLDELGRFCREHRLRLVEAAPPSAQPAQLPLPAGQFSAVAVPGPVWPVEHLALRSVGPTSSPATAVPVYVHLECRLGDIFGSLGCQCAHDLAEAVRRAAAQPGSVIVYLREDPAGVGHPDCSQCGTSRAAAGATHALLTTLGVERAVFTGSNFKNHHAAAQTIASLPAA